MTTITARSSSAPAAAAHAALRRAHAPRLDGTVHHVPGPIKIDKNPSLVLLPKGPVGTTPPSSDGSCGGPGQPSCGGGGGGVGNGGNCGHPGQPACNVPSSQGGGGLCTGGKVGAGSICPGGGGGSGTGSTTPGTGSDLPGTGSNIPGTGSNTPSTGSNAGSPFPKFPGKVIVINRDHDHHVPVNRDDEPVEHRDGYVPVNRDRYVPVQEPDRGTVGGPVASTPRAPATCLTKEYLQTGVVLFKDVCTPEWAMNSTTVTRPVTSATARDCLTKENLANGVLFRDVCTNEWAMNSPDQQPHNEF